MQYSKWICQLLLAYNSIFGRQSVSSNVHTLILDVKNTNSIQEAVNTVKRLLPPSAGTVILDACVYESVTMCYSR